MTNYLDEEGCPTDELIRFIEEYQETPEMPILKFLEIIKTCWWNPDFGFSLELDESEEHYNLELHTGGWSGNESIIEAITCNPHLTVVSMKYVQWNVGGHYRFKVPKK